LAKNGAIPWLLMLWCTLCSTMTSPPLSSYLITFVVIPHHLRPPVRKSEYRGGRVVYWWYKQSVEQSPSLRRRYRPVSPGRLRCWGHPRTEDIHEDALLGETQKACSRLVGGLSLLVLRTVPGLSAGFTSPRIIIGYQPCAASQRYCKMSQL
jgi:hypothetical protein